MNIPDNYDLFEANESRYEQWLKSLPVCEHCRDPIQQEDAVCLDGSWFCDECLENNRKEVEV